MNIFTTFLLLFSLRGPKKRFVGFVNKKDKKRVSISFLWIPLRDWDSSFALTEKKDKIYSNFGHKILYEFVLSFGLKVRMINESFELNKSFVYKKDLKKSTSTTDKENTIPTPTEIYAR